VTAPPNAAGPDGLVDGNAPGQPPKFNDAQRQAFLRIVESGPIPAVHEVVRWRLNDLAQWVWVAIGNSIVKQTLSRELRAMDFAVSSLAGRLRRSGPGQWRKLTFLGSETRGCLRPA
jgi:hypothetical protein